jgi:hypothetical protein
MQHYLRLAGKGFAICAAISCLFLSIVSVVPWEQSTFELVGAYFCFSGAYICCFLAVLRDIVTRQRMWANPRARFLGVPLFGASVGLFFLGWSAILRPSDLADIRTDEFERFLCGVGPEQLWMPARQLMCQAEILGACKMLIENSVQYAAAFVVLAMVGIAIGDTKLLF